MRIQHNIQALNATRQLGVNSDNAGKSMEKLSSGYRINRAGDDAAGLAISEKMRSQIRGLDQASTNAQDGISMLQTAEGALQETHDMLQRMKELAVQSANGNYTDENRASIGAEVEQLRTEITRIADSTEFNGKKILGASAGDTIFQVGAMNGATNTIKVGLSKMGASQLGFSKASAASVSTQAKATATISNVEKAITTVSSYRGKLGAMQNRLEHTIKNIGVTVENVTAAESRVRDVNMAKEMMNFTKDNILTQASQSMLSQANQLPQGVLQLLR